MVKKILNLFIGEYGLLHKTALIFNISSIVSAAFGILRDRLLAGKLRRRKIFGYLLRRLQNSGFHLHHIPVHHLG